MISDDTLHQPKAIDHDTLREFVDRKWNDEIVPALTDYIAVPAKSPAFDPEWVKHGFIERVVTDAAQWAEHQPVKGLKLEVIRLPGRTPVIFFETPATRSGSTETIVLYGHLDKQPEFDGWRNDLGPWTPKLENDKLYGRGGADDGYAIYASLTALAALDAQGVERPRCVGLIETCEESGSYDLLPYVDVLRERLGKVGLVVCLDSGAGNYDQLWLTTSLRGLVSGDLEVQVLDEGIHSGGYGGITPSSFRIMRQLFDRLEDASNGNLLPRASIPRSRQTVCAKPRRRRRFWATTSGRKSRGRAVRMAARCCLPRRIPRKRCSIPHGVRRYRSRARPVCRPSPMPAMCCVRALHSSCRCACRR